MVFHAGTILQDGVVMTNGGRILCCTSRDLNANVARKKTIAIADTITFESKDYRRDIGLMQIRFVNIIQNTLNLF
jgi:phosphoribosylamine--glycine ligase